jgi:transposase
MIDAEEWLDMKSMYQNGMSISEIARRTGHDRKTVSKYVKGDANPPRPKPRKKRPSKLDPYKEYIKERIEEHNLSAVRLLEDIQKMGYDGCYSLVRDYARPLRKDRAITAVYRYETAPGVQAQVDWLDAGPLEIDGGVSRSHAFVMVMGHSRAKYVEFTLDTSTATFIRCHLNAFEHFGGYTKELLYDNTKNVVLRRAMMSSDSTWNPLFEDFFHHFGFIPRLCKPYRAQTKGKVESVVKFVKYNFLAGRQFSSIQELNAETRSWLRKADSRPHDTTGVPPLQRLEEERPELLCIVDKPPYQIVQKAYRKISRDCFVSYLANKYSVPWKHAGREATLLIHSNRMMIQVGGEVVCEHELRAGSGNVVRVREHMAGLYKETRARNLLIQERGPPKQSRLQVGPVVEQRSLSVYDQFMTPGGL